MIYAQPDTAFEARVDGFPAGLTGTVGVRILDDQGATELARSTAGITENPAGSGSYTVQLLAPDEAGAYTVFWDTGVVSPSTTASDALLVTASGAPPATPDGYTPTVAEVGALIRARTVDSNGVQLGTFTANTRPTAEEVSELIGQAAQWMALRIGASPADALIGPARALVALYTAMLVESSYYGEQIEANRSQYPQLEKLYEDGLKILLDVRRELGADAAAGTDDDLSTSGLAQFSFNVLDTPSRAPGTLVREGEIVRWVW